MGKIIQFLIARSGIIAIIMTALTLVIGLGGGITLKKQSKVNESLTIENKRLEESIQSRNVLLQISKSELQFARDEISRNELDKLEVAKITDEIEKGINKILSKHDAQIQNDKECSDHNSIPWPTCRVGMYKELLGICNPESRNYDIVQCEASNSRISEGNSREVQ